jgi:enamine deaminase RidA (YjgF/YER057c/UK114 family)
MTTIEQRLQEMGVSIPDMPAPLANYVPAVRTGNLIFTAGQICSVGDKLFKGKLGRDINTAQGKEATKLCIINCLAAVKKLLGSLETVKQIVAVHGLISSDPEFTEQGMVMNGASDFLVALFGEAGKHTRTAVGVASLPFDFSASVYMIVEVVE